MKTRLTIVLLLMTALCADAQSDRFRGQFEAFRKQAETRYSDFRNKCNESYAEFLRKSWENYHSVRLEKPKDEPLPPVRYENLPVVNNPIVIKDTLKLAPVPPRPKPVEPVKVAPTPSAPTFSFKFYGEQLTVRADREKMFSLPSISENDVADAWSEITDSEYDSTLEDLLNIRESHFQCDWAYFQMVFSFSDAFTGNADKATVLSAWLLCQSGYKIRLARTDKQLCFLFASEYRIFGANYFTIDGERFYCMNGEAKEVKIADACSFPKESGMSFAMEHQPRLGEDYSAARSLKSEKYASARVSSSVNVNLIKFLSTYPDTQYGDNFMTRWAMFAETPMDNSCKEKIYPSLKKSIEGKSELEAVNILLDFVQTAFKYEYDDKVWGYDRIFFAEESLYYDYCDCEDRSILFSRLVRDLLGLDVALIYYPGHLATAVRFNSEVYGDYFETAEGRFTVCDPTYIGAPAGATMPEMEDKEATLIRLK